MKTKNSLSLIIVLAFTVLGCKKGGVFCYEGNGTITTETRVLEAFSSIELAMSADVFVTQGADYAVKVEASENLMGIIETKVKSDKLIIDVKNNKCIRGNETISVYITLPNLSALNISGSGKIKVSNYLETEKLTIKISGSGDVEIDSLAANEIAATISGSGDLSVTGTDTVAVQIVEVSGSGKVQNINLPSREASVNISGSGECLIYAIETLDVRISGSGNVRYKGNPTITTAITGSGNIYPY